jgi:predicted metal-binding protein
MTDSEILALVGGEPILAAAGILPTSALVFEPAYRKYCEDNVCGQYGANYSCPPACGTPEQMKRRALRYRRVLVVQSTWEVPGLKDLEKLARGKRSTTTCPTVSWINWNRRLCPRRHAGRHCDRCPEGAGWCR